MRVLFLVWVFSGFIFFFFFFFFGGADILLVVGVSKVISALYCQCDSLFVCVCWFFLLFFVVFVFGFLGFFNK